MNESQKDKKLVYEISYLIPTSVPDEKVSEEAEALKKLVNEAGANILAEGAPFRERLAYTMRKKTVSGSYEKYDEAYFGWLKFELDSDKIEGVKKAFESHPAVLRFLLIKTVAENTYLGKRASAIALSIPSKPENLEAKSDDNNAEIAAPAEPISLEEVDKSIDEMVKEV